MSEAMKYRKKPVIIEAMRIGSYLDLLGPTDSAGPGRVWEWVTDNGGTISAFQEDPGPVYGLIWTLEGTMQSDLGDWIIRGVKGEFYPCKPDIFDLTYEAVTE
jgi:hypothetical protein